MRRELQSKLYKDFPLLYKMDVDERTNLMCFGFECGDGWYQLIRELCEKLYPLVEKARSEQSDDSYLTCVSQVKEKYGILRFNMSCETGEMSELIEQYEERSLSVCELCGSEGSRKKRLSWFSTRCEEHSE